MTLIFFNGPTVILLLFISSVSVPEVLGEPGNKPSLDAYEEGVRLIQRNDIRGNGTKEGFDKGIEKLELAVQLDPTFVEAHVDLGQAYWNKSFFYITLEQEQLVLRKKAVSMYQKAVAIDPNNARAIENLMYRTKDEKEQLLLLRRLIEVDATHPRAHDLLANRLLSQGKLDEAIEEYRIHLDVSPFLGQQYANDVRVFARSLTKAGRVKESVEMYEKLMNLMKKGRRYERCAAFDSFDLTPYSKFQGFVKKVEKLRPYCTNLEHRNRAVQLKREGKIDEAISELQLQLEVNPYYEETYSILEGIYKKQGQMDKALDVVKKSIEIEEEPIERCKRYERYKGYSYLGEKIYEQFEKQSLEQLKQDCEQEQG